MKKIGIVGLVLACLSATFVPGSDAARNSYETYQSPKREAQKEASEKMRKSALFMRAFSDRRFGYSKIYEKHTDFVTPKENVRMMKNVRHPKIEIRDPYAQMTIHRRKKDRNRKVLLWKEALATESKKEMTGKIRSFATFANDVFSIRVPGNLELTVSEETGAALFKSPGSEYLVVVAPMGDLCKGNVSFRTCAVAVSKTRNKAEKLYVASKMQRSERLANVMLSTEEQAQTFTENFMATRNGQQQFFVSRYFVQDPFGQLFLVETRIPELLAEPFVEISKQVFDSFRLIQ